jgi:predicted metalloprotease with PDZ domain
MTHANLTRSPQTLDTALTLHYTVAMPQPASHLFEVSFQIRGWALPVLDLKMPVWTPGSYLVREYARHVQDFSAAAFQPPQTLLSWHKCSKNHWQIDTDGISEVQITYRVFADDLSVRTNHLDLTHGYLNGAAVFFFIPGYLHQPIQVTVKPPYPDWQVTTALTPEAHHPYTFQAADFDELVDSPIEVGTHQILDFTVEGKPHQLAIWGRGNLDAQRLVNDIQKIVVAESHLFQGLPYDRYLFLLHLSAQGFGGLEHKNSCSLNYPRLGFQSEEKYQRFLQLVAHEFFHLWNIKRIRPKALEVFNYEAENYTPSLWFSEGTTSYYDLLIPFRAGLYDAQTFLRELGNGISRYLQVPGRMVQPLSESSFDAWIKLYRRDAHSDNSQISYYLKGEMVSLLLDLLIRARHQNQRSLDDVLLRLWQAFGREEIGFTPKQLEAVITEVADVSLDSFFHCCLHTTEELPFDVVLEPFGLQIQAEGTAHHPPFLGLTVTSEQGRAIAKFVEAGSPAQQAGVDAGDELLAIDGLRVTAEQLGDRLKDYRPGDELQLTFFHQDELYTRSVRLALARPSRYTLTAVKHPSLGQQQLFQGWLGTSLQSVFSE